METYQLASRQAGSIGTYYPYNPNNPSDGGTIEIVSDNFVIAQLTEIQRGKKTTTKFVVNWVLDKPEELEFQITLSG